MDGTAATETHRRNTEVEGIASGVQKGNERRGLAALLGHADLESLLWRWEADKQKGKRPRC